MTYPRETDIEAPEADAAEQARDALPSRDGAAPYAGDDLEAPEWDAREQHEVVELDDEYR